VTCGTRQLVRQFEERHEELAQALAIEAGKPIKCGPTACMVWCGRQVWWYLAQFFSPPPLAGSYRDARVEITRGIDTFTIAAEEATRLYGEYRM